MYRFQQTKAVAGITSTPQANLPIPLLCASARVLPIRSRMAVSFGPMRFSDELLGAIKLTAGYERLSLPNRMVHRMTLMSDEQRPME